ncbi:uncharacterized protein LOC112568575 [Pomacea canaliculata]|uniref:uncharacterized protein LOC112568575 n=1 Tax=Pomacea canaliculata TaxID=400727 RepID=UPI000D7395FD|nr:uncharacterized protein LOC112568575 [Pomacea canaliculata]
MLSLFGLFFPVFVVLQTAISQEICARLKFVNLTNDLLVAENDFINITFYMTTENCSGDPLYTITVSTSVDKVDEKTDHCKIRVQNGAYSITEQSKSCRMWNSGNKIEFSQEVHPSVRKLIFIVSTRTAKSVYTVIPVERVTREPSMTTGEEDMSTLTSTLESSSASTVCTTCAKVKVDNITDGVLRVPENTVVSLMLHLETENCPQNLTYFLRVFIVLPKLRHEVDMCKIVVVDDVHRLSDNSAHHCHPGSSDNNIKFTFNATSLDMRLGFTLASLDMVSTATYINISEEFTPVDALPSILEDNEQLHLTSKPTAPGLVFVD